MPYKILTSNLQNSVDFGSVVVNAPMLRSFTIKNISSKPLLLKLASLNPDEIQVLLFFFEIKS